MIILIYDVIVDGENGLIQYDEFTHEATFTIGANGIYNVIRHHGFLSEDLKTLSCVKFEYEYASWNFFPIGSGSTCNIGGYTGWHLDFSSSLHSFSGDFHFYPDYDISLPYYLPPFPYHRLTVQTGFSSIGIPIGSNDLIQDYTFGFGGGKYCYSSGSGTFMFIKSHFFVEYGICCNLNFNSISRLLNGN